jgi:hypothetical protein
MISKKLLPKFNVLGGQCGKKYHGTKVSILCWTGKSVGILVAEAFWWLRVEYIFDKLIT